jgi:hypothetical protein
LAVFAVGLFCGAVQARPPGFIETTIPLDAPPVALAFDDGGALFALEGAPFGSNAAVLRKILPNGTFDGSFPIVGNDAENFFVGSMTHDPIGGRLLISDNTADGRIYSVDSLGMQQTFATGIAGVAGIAVRTTGEIFVSTSPFGSPGEVLQVDRATGTATPVLTGLGFGAGLAFDVDGNLIVQDADTTTFQGRLQRLPMTSASGGLEIGSPVAILAGMQSGAGVSVDSEGDIFTTGSGGLFRIDETTPAEVPFDNNGTAFQFATAIAFDAGDNPFEPFRGPDGGRLAYMADFGFSQEDEFVTLLTPAAPGDYNADGEVDTDDYALWRQTIGAANDLSADGNLDGELNAADYVVWRKFATSGAAGMLVPAPNLGVPEPAACAMWMVQAAVVLQIRRRHR